MRALGLVTVLLATAAFAQRDDFLYVNPSLSPSSTRLSAMANASVGLAEQAESLQFNAATVVHRSPLLDQPFDWSLSFSLLSTPFGGWRDIENDGKPTTSVIPLEGTLAVYFQIKRFGIGGFGRVTGRDLCLDEGTCTQRLTTVAAYGGFVLGYSFWDDQILAAVTLNLNSATFSTPGARVAYNGQSLATGFLWRPRGRQFRMGFQALSENVGRLTEGNATELAGRPVFQGIVTPTKVSMGASWRLGKHADKYNRPSKQLMSEMVEAGKPTPQIPAWDDLQGAPPGPLLFSVQVELNFPVRNATTVRTFLFNEEHHPTGGNLTIVPRFGAEWEVLEHRLRLRLGTWLEPNFVEGSTIRPHGTFGFEVFLFELWQQWSIAGAVDIAPRYLSLNLGIGFWI